MTDHAPVLAAENPFDAIRQVRPDGTEFWSARDLQKALGYAEWRKFEDAIERAKVACLNSGNEPAEHFVPAAKTLLQPNQHGVFEREVADWYLSRYGAYLVAMNGDPRKPEIAGAQMYFAAKTREAETARPALPNFANPAEAARAWADEYERRQLVEQQLAIAAPKAESHDAYIGTEGLHDWNSVAKMIGQGRNKMLAELRRRKVLMTGGDKQNLPYQEYVDRGYFEVKARSVKVLGFEKVATTTYVTPKGVEFLHRLLNREVAA